MAKNYKLTVKFNAGNVGTAYNVFYLQYNAVTSPTDGAVLAVAVDWINRIYSPLRTYMSTAYVGAGCQVDELATDGTVARHLGSVSPTISGNSASDPNSGPTAMSGFIRTAVPKVRGSKRFPGIVDTNVVGQLLTNAALSALSSAVAQWFGNFGSGVPWRAGVWSAFAGGFVPFATSAQTTNVPGTQVTRKPFRGA